MVVDDNVGFGSQYDLGVKGQDSETECGDISYTSADIFDGLLSTDIFLVLIGILIGHEISHPQLSISLF